MPVLRNVFGNIKDLTGVNVTGDDVVFDFTGSYDSDSNYVASSKFAKIDANGDFNADLLVTEGIHKDSTHTATFPSSESFSFKLPLGNGDPINITTLRDMAALGVFLSDDTIIIDGGSPADEVDLIISGGSV